MSCFATSIRSSGGKLARNECLSFGSKQGPGLGIFWVSGPGVGNSSVMVTNGAVPILARSIRFYFLNYIWSTYCTKKAQKAAISSIIHVMWFFVSVGWWWWSASSHGCCSLKAQAALEPPNPTLWATMSLHCMIVIIMIRIHNTVTLPTPGIYNSCTPLLS